MNIIRAEYMGLCFGVRDALAIAHETTDPSSVTIYGELVHNPNVQMELRSAGFQVVTEQQRETAMLTDRVMITAHGISQRRLSILQKHSSEIIDTTCPLVRRVHEASQTLAQENRLIVLIGRHNHVEVQGVIEDLSRYEVVEDPSDVVDWKEPSIGVISQSTSTPDLVSRCTSRILELNRKADIRTIDTICRPTRQRQIAMETLCQTVPLVIVVGGRHSNNTRQLTDRCAELGCKAIQVESADELCDEWFDGLDTVGLTAGTSTPDRTVDAVELRLKQISGRVTSEVQEEKNLQQATSHDGAHEGFSQAWLDYFSKNQSVEPWIPWSETPTLTEAERTAVAKSIQVFQLGETGCGKHFLRRAHAWCIANDDPDYRSAASRFIDEEHRHARWLGKFLEQEGLITLEKQWTDSIFRRLRRLAGLRTAIAVLVSAEIMAQVYYRALKQATDSDTLQALCHQILREEAKHVQFQVLQLGRMDRKRNPIVRRCLRWTDRVLFGIASWVVYCDHRSVFEKAAIPWKAYRRLCNRRWLATDKIYRCELRTDLAAQFVSHVSGMA
jgi:(E)-4-hydroxy-3-methyl-but-2-enyl pyrophosphate reductase